MANPTVLKATFTIAFSLAGCLIYHSSKKNGAPSSSSSSSYETSPSSTLSSVSTSYKPSCSEPSVADDDCTTNHEHSETCVDSQKQHQQLPPGDVSPRLLKVDAMETDQYHCRLEIPIFNYLELHEDTRDIQARIMVIEHTIKNLMTEKKGQARSFSSRTLLLQARVAKTLLEARRMKRKQSKIEELKCEISELKGTNSMLRNAKDEMMRKLKALESSNPSLMEAREADANMAMTTTKRLTSSKEKLLRQIEELQMMNQAPTDHGELLYLRWSNACLRYEFIRSREEKNAKSNEAVEPDAFLLEERESIEYKEYGENCTDHCLGESPLTIEISEPASSEVLSKGRGNATKKKICHKIKGWVKRRQYK